MVRTQHVQLQHIGEIVLQFKHHKRFIRFVLWRKGVADLTKVVRAGQVGISGGEDVKQRQFTKQQIRRQQKAGIGQRVAGFKF